MTDRYETVVRATMALAAECEIRANQAETGEKAWRMLAEALFSAAIESTDRVLPDAELHRLADLAHLDALHEIALTTRDAPVAVGDLHEYRY